MMTKMAGVTHAKTLFAKNPVFALPIRLLLMDQVVNAHPILVKFGHIQSI